MRCAGNLTRQKNLERGLSQAPPLPSTISTRTDLVCPSPLSPEGPRFLALSRQDEALTGSVSVPEMTLENPACQCERSERWVIEFRFRRLRFSPCLFAKAIIRLQHFAVHTSPAVIAPPPQEIRTGPSSSPLATFPPPPHHPAQRTNKAATGDPGRPQTERKVSVSPWASAPAGARARYRRPEGSAEPLTHRGRLLACHRPCRT